MHQFILTTDSASDLPESYLQAHQIEALSLRYIMDDVTYGVEQTLDTRDFYQRLRNGALPTTSAVNTEESAVLFRKYLEEGKDILHIAFSSGLSTTYNAARIAAEELREEFPDRKLIVIDSLCASLGQGLLVEYARSYRDEGMSIEEAAQKVQDLIPHLVHNFTVNDLFHLHRGGRVSKATAIVGSIINIKPILHVDDEGHLIALSKTRGRKNSIQALVTRMKAQTADYDVANQTVFISHGDCEDEAQYLADLIRDQLGVSKFLINYVGPVIGTHSGPGTLALFFVGSNR